MESFQVLEILLRLFKSAVTIITFIIVIIMVVVIFFTFLQFVSFYPDAVLYMWYILCINKCTLILSMWFTCLHHVLKSIYKWSKLSFYGYFILFLTQELSPFVLSVRAVGHKTPQTTLWAHTWNWTVWNLQNERKLLIIQ